MSCSHFVSYDHLNLPASFIGRSKIFSNQSISSLKGSEKRQLLTFLDGDAQCDQHFQFKKRLLLIFITESISSVHLHEGRHSFSMYKGPISIANVSAGSINSCAWSGFNSPFLSIHTQISQKTARHHPLYQWQDFEELQINVANNTTIWFLQFLFQLGLDYGYLFICFDSFWSKHCKSHQKIYANNTTLS